MTLKKLGSTTLLHHPRMTIVEDDIQMPNGHVTKYIHHINTNDSVTVIALLQDQVLIQQEYSYPPNQIMYQFPGGGIQDGEQSMVAALRELKEESGYTGKTTYLGSYYFDNRRSSAKMHVVLVRDVIECTKEGGDIEESIDSEWVAVDKLRSMVASGEIVNLSILAGMTFYDARSK